MFCVTLYSMYCTVDIVYQGDKNWLLCSLSFNSYLSLLTVIKVLFLEFLWPATLLASLWQISYLYSIWAHCIYPWWPELLIITKRWENIYLFVTIALIMDEYILWERGGRLGGREGGGADHVTKCWWQCTVVSGVGLGRNNHVQLVTT